MTAKTIEEIIEDSQTKYAVEAFQKVVMALESLPWEHACKVLHAAEIILEPKKAVE